MKTSHFIGEFLMQTTRNSKSPYLNKIFLIFLLGFFSFGSFAQSSLTEEQVQEYTTLGSQLEGTFQIQMIDTRTLPTFQLHLYPLIKEARKQNEVTFIRLSDNMRIKIYPKNLIESNNFVPVERITHINSSDI